MNEPPQSDELLFDEIRAVLQHKSANDPVSPVPILVNRQIGDFTILSEIHRGGQGIVYEATQQRPTRRVALKVLLHGAFSSQRQRFRFEREIEIIASLNHPNIVTIFDSGFVDGQPYYVMEYIDGVPLNDHSHFVPDLSAIATASKQHIDRCLELLQTICDAVNCFQQVGLIHRDLKPDNILLDQDNVPHIVDFGLARRTDGTDSDSVLETADGEFLGTLAYAAPEQFEGDKKKTLDSRCDVYALGVILFELLTGKVPRATDGSLATIISKICEEDAIAPSSINSSIDRDIDTIVLKSLERDPDRRYQSAAQLAEDIQRYRRGLPIEARRNSALYVFRKTIRRHWKAYTVAAVFLTLLVVSSFVTFQLWQRAERRLQRAERAEEAAIQSEKNEAYQRGEAEFRSYVASLAAALAAIREYRIGDAYDHLFACPEQHRNFEWQYALSRIDTSINTWDLQPGLQKMATCPGARLIAVSGLNGHLRILDSESGEVQLSRSDAGHVTALGFVPDGTRLIVGTEDGQLRDLSVASNTWVQQRRPLPTVVTALKVTPNGRTLVAASTNYPDPAAQFAVRDLMSDMDIFTDDALVYAIDVSADSKRIVTGGDVISVRDASTGKIIRSVSMNSKWCRQLSFLSPEEVVAIEPDQRIVIRNSETLQMTESFPHHDSTIHGFAVHPAGETFATGSADGTVRIWNPSTGKPSRVFWGHLGWVNDLAYSPDGERLLSIENRGGVKIWNPAVEVADLHLKAHESSVLDIHFIADGDTVATGSFTGQVRLWDVKTGKHQTAFSRHTASVNTIAVSGDSRWLASGSADQSVRLWDTSTGKSRPLKGHTAEVVSVCISNDGEIIAAGAKDGQIRIWDRQSRAEIALLDSSDQRPVRWLRFLPDERQIIAERDKSIEVWHLDRRAIERQWTKSGSTWYPCVAIDPTATRLATGDESGAVTIWNISNGTEIGRLEWHQMALTAVAFHPGGTRLAAASLDGAVKIWHIERQVSLMTLPVTRQIVTDLHFHPDGKRLAAAQFDGTMIWWEAIAPNERLGLRF